MSTTITSATVSDLAAEFIVAAASDPRPWVEVLQSWPPFVELTEAEHHELRVLILRRRVFNSTAIGVSRARARAAQGRRR